MTTDTNEISTMVAFGQVVNVRPIPTRQVTQIVIEIPDNHHIAATTMLFGKNAFVLAANPKATVPFGVVPLEKMNETTPAESSAEPRAGLRIRGGLTVDVNPTQWLGVQCQSAMFMNWIGAQNAQEAAEKVRLKCGVSSRSEISKSPQALETFLLEIYNPYSAYARRAEQDRRAVMASAA